MFTCPNCGMGAIHGEFCPDCGVKVSPREPEVAGPGDRALGTQAVYLAPDEMAAVSVQKILEAEGIPSWSESLQVPGPDGLLRVVEGYWGRVLVFEDEEARARRVIEDYLRAIGPGVH